MSAWTVVHQCLWPLNFFKRRSLIDLSAGTSFSIYACLGQKIMTYKNYKISRTCKKSLKKNRVGYDRIRNRIQSCNSEWRQTEQNVQVGFKTGSVIRITSPLIRIRKKISTDPEYMQDIQIQNQRRQKRHTVSYGERTKNSPDRWHWQEWTWPDADKSCNQPHAVLYSHQI